MRKPNDLLRFSLVMICLLVLQKSAHAFEEKKTVKGPCRDTELIAYRGLAYFCADREGFGREVHVTDGSEYGSRVLKDLDPGPGSSSPFGFFVYQERLYFIAETTPTGLALWRSDGTDAGTTLVRSLDVEVPNSVDLDFANDIRFGLAPPTNGRQYFRVGENVFVTDGTYSGTRKTDARFVDGSVSSFGTNHPTSWIVHNDLLYTLTGNVLHRVLLNGQIQEIYTFPSYAGVPSFSPIILPAVEFLGGFLIQGTTGATGENELWQSNGSHQGTRKLFSPAPVVVGVKNGRLLFLDNPKGIDTPVQQSTLLNLYATSDGVNKVLIKGQLNFDDGIRACPQTAFAGKRLISGLNGHTWITDGTRAGTFTMPFDALAFNTETPGQSVDVSNCEIQTLNGRLVGLGDGDSGNGSVWISNGERGNAITVRNLDSQSHFKEVAITSNAFYFYSKRDASSDELTLWKLSQSFAVSQVAAIPFSWIDYANTEGQRLFFTPPLTVTNTPNNLWHTDGSRKNTYQLKYILENRFAEIMKLVPLINYLLEDDENHVTP